MNMKSNLAHKQEVGNEISLHPSTAKKLERQAMSLTFEKGFVPSSRLYRYEVRPFLSDAAKNVYAELEDRINGFKDKVTDHVSYSQLQGGKLEGANKLSTTTVAKGLKELLAFGVISLVSESNRKGNEYQINEISLVGHFKNQSTTLETKALQKVKRQHFSNESASALETKDTIELSRTNYRTIYTQGNAPEKIKINDEWKPDLNFLKTLIQQSNFSNRADEVLAMSDFQFHLGNFNAHWENKTPLTENQNHRKFAAWLIQEFEKAERKNQVAKKQTTYQPQSSKNSKTMQAHDEFFASYGIGGSTANHGDFIDAHSTEIKTIGGAE